MCVHYKAVLNYMITYCFPAIYLDCVQCLYRFICPFGMQGTEFLDRLLLFVEKQVILWGKCHLASPEHCLLHVSSFGEVILSFTCIIKTVWGSKERAELDTIFLWEKAPKCLGPELETSQHCMYGVSKKCTKQYSVCSMACLQQGLGGHMCPVHAKRGWVGWETSYILS